MCTWRAHGGHCVSTLEVFYIQLRPHQYNGGLTPNESERLYWENSKTVTNFC